MDDNLLDALKRCLDLLDENSEILTNLQADLDDENEDELISNLSLHNLYDMAEDVAESSKIKRAESNLMRRQT